MINLNYQKHLYCDKKQRKILKAGKHLAQQNPYFVPDIL